jgi:hypothetical protein
LTQLLGGVCESFLSSAYVPGVSVPAIPEIINLTSSVTGTPVPAAETRRPSSFLLVGTGMLGAAVAIQRRFVETHAVAGTRLLVEFRLFCELRIGTAKSACGKFSDGLTFHQVIDAVRWPPLRYFHKNY